ncbi:hypothetical protein BIU87_19740 [Streptomyces sp. ZS0098]|nr:hypothetical protein BIU87_19740 [Streptomyces sp. ZS0098]
MHGQTTSDPTRRMRRRRHAHADTHRHGQHIRRGGRTDGAGLEDPPRRTGRPTRAQAHRGPWSAEAARTGRDR